MGHANEVSFIDGGGTFFCDISNLRTLLNNSMKRYKATVNAAGMWVETILYAQNQAQAYKLFQAIFGANNVPHQPLQIG